MKSKYFFIVILFFILSCKHEINQDGKELEYFDIFTENDCKYYFILLNNEYSFKYMTSGPCFSQNETKYIEKFKIGQNSIQKMKIDFYKNKKFLVEISEKFDSNKREIISREIIKVAEKEFRKKVITLKSTENTVEFSFE